MRANPTIRHIKIISGPLEGFDNNNNAGARYLTQLYAAGRRIFGWGQPQKPFPFDGVGYHLYIAEGERSQVGQALRAKYSRYMDELRDAIVQAEGSAKPIFISEIGWANPGSLHSLQQEAMQAALDSILNDSNVALGIWFCTQDFPGKPYGVYPEHTLSSDARKPIFQTLQSCCATELTTENGALNVVETHGVDEAAYVSGGDWIQDDTPLPLGHPFAQSWQMTNRGSTTWGGGYKCTHVGDQRMGAPDAVDVPACAPGQTVRLTVPFVVPNEPGTHQSTWQLVNPAGERFGQRIWTRIVATPVAGQDGTVGVQEMAPPVGSLFNVAAIQDDVSRSVATTWNRYGGLLQREASRLGIDPGVAVATLVAESKGDAFGPDNRMIIRFENHIFYEQWGKQNQAVFNQHFQMDPNTPWQPAGHKWRANSTEEWRACHTNQETEWRVFSLARGLDANAAIQSISMGAPQVMGFNYRMLGYATAQEMFSAFQGNVRDQILSLFRFMEVNNLVEAVRTGDYHEFARVYNGSGQAADYARLIERNLTSFRSLQAAQVAGRGMLIPAQPPEAPITRMPLPPSPQPGQPLSQADPELYAAWRAHIKRGFENNQTMFEQILAGFMNPYWSTVWMYRILFGVGIGAFLAALLVALLDIRCGNYRHLWWSQRGRLLDLLLNRPLQALEENLQFITWPGRHLQ